MYIKIIHRNYIKGPQETRLSQQGFFLHWHCHWCIAAVCAVGPPPVAGAVPSFDTSHGSLYP